MMATNTSGPEVEERGDASIREALERLDNGCHELELDFSAVRRVDPGMLRELEQLAAKAQERSVNVVLRGVNVEVYKVLKLIRLAGKFSFRT